MGIKLTTDPGTGVVTVQAVGELEAGEAERFLIAFYRGTGNRAPPAMLWDLPRASLDPSIDIPSVTSFIRRHRPNRPGCTAVVADQEVTYGLSRMGQAYLEDLQIDFHVFRNREEALSWLRDCCSSAEMDDPD